MAHTRSSSDSKSPPLPGSQREVSIHVPRRFTRFVGRDEEMEALRRAVEMKRRLVTVTGAAGSGKTRLAQEWAHSGNSTDVKAVWFCDLSATTNLSEVCQVVTGILRLPVANQHPVRSLARLLRGQGAIVLILDNAEHVRDAVGTLISQALCDAPDIRFVVTSRLPLQLPQEEVLRVSSLSCSGPSSSEAGEGPAYELFVARVAQATGGGTEAVESDVQWIEQIINDLGGLPLAIEIAAAQLRYISLPELAERVHTSSPSLRSRQRSIPSRQMTVRDSLDWSWKLLNPWEQYALAQLSVFVGPFLPEHGAVVLDCGDFAGCPDGTQILATLVDHSLLIEEEGTDGLLRYTFLPPVRLWAGTQLDSLQSHSPGLDLSGCRVTADGLVVPPKGQPYTLKAKEYALLRYLAARAGQSVSRETLLEEVWGYEEATVTRTVDTTMRNVRKHVDVGAFTHLHTDRGVGYRFEALPDQRLVRKAAERRHAQCLLDFLGDGNTHSAPEVILRLGAMALELLAATRRAAKQGDGALLYSLACLVPNGAVLFQNAMFFAEEVERLHPAPDLDVWLTIAQWHRLVADYDAARRIVEQCRDEVETSQPSRGHVLFYQLDSQLYRDSHGTTYDVDATKKSVAAADAVGWTNAAVVMRMQLGNRLIKLGRIEEAEKLFIALREGAQSDRWSAVMAAVDLARIQRFRGDYAQAEKRMTEAFESADRWHSPVQAAFVYQHHVEQLCELSELTGAPVHLERCAENCEALKRIESTLASPRVSLVSSYAMGLLARCQGQNDAAVLALRQAIELAHGLEHRAVEAECKMALARCLLRRGEVSTALVEVEGALELIGEGNDLELECRAHLVLCDVYGQGQREQDWERAVQRTRALAASLGAQPGSYVLWELERVAQMSFTAAVEEA